MKKLYFLFSLVFCLICSHSSSAQMRQLSEDVNDMNEVQEFSFYSPSEGYVAFTEYIGFTTDSGRTFTRKLITLSNVNFNGYPVNLTLGFGIKGVKAFNQDTIIVYGDYGLVPSILYSTDKGNSFTLVYSDRYDGFAFKTGITSMVFPQDHITGYAVEADRILKTTDRGLNWSVVRLDVDRYYDDVVSVDNNNVFAFSTKYSSDKLFKTNDGGNTWVEITVPPGQIIYAHFLTAAKGWLIIKNDDQNGVVYYTSNGGITWDQKNDPLVTPFYGYKFRFVNDSTGYSLAGYFVYKTTDSGKVWQPLPRDNNFSYLNYYHNDLQILNQDQMWAGGGHGFIEINTNSTGNPLPTAFFRIDTNGIAATGTVNLRNYSKQVYQYKWFKNDTLISTSFHTSFTHDIYQFRDTIKLVVSDGTHNDTLVKYIDYPKVWITSFTPTSAANGNVVTINGYNFSTVFSVRFGGVPASSFSIISNTQIKATVGGGASGNVEVTTASMGTGTMGGFTYLGIPRVDLPSSISDSILCKSEPVKVTIQNSEPGVAYSLINWSDFRPISGSATGNGGTVSFVTSPITTSGRYRIQATRIGVPGGQLFPDNFNIKVEHTQARFVADQVNVNPGETVTYAVQAGEARDYLWTFYQDASTATATGAKVTGISYAGSGQKTLQLISISENGCADTVSANAVFVYPGSSTNASCFINPMDSTGATGMTVTQVMSSYDDGIFVIGSTGGAPKLHSSTGVSKKFGAGDHNFFAKYNAGGVLKWVHYFKPGAGAFTAGQTDAQGNIYLTGYAVSTQWLYFNNGDSIAFYAAPVDTTYMGSRTNGFILKLDRNGRYIWHTILYDHITLWQGYAANASGEHIAIKDDHIIVIGGFFSKLSYARNGIIQQLYDLPSDYKVHDNHAVLKIRPDGTLIWNAVLRFQFVNSHRLSDVSVDLSGNSYLVGTYEQYLGIYDASGVERAKLQGQVADFRGFMVKYDATGSLQWNNNFVSTYQYGDTRINKVVADDDGNTYVAGEMSGYGQPGSFLITHTDGTVVSDSLSTFALYKFDNNGKRRWAVGSRYSYYGGTGALYTRGNEVYAAGRLYNNGVPYSAFVLTSSDGNNKTLNLNSSECFVAKYDTSGVFKRVYTSGYNYNAAWVTPTNLYINSKDQFILGGNARKSIGGDLSKLFGITWPHLFQSLGDGFFVKMQPDFCQPALTANAGPDKIGCTGDTVSLGSNSSGDYYSWTSNPAGFTSNLPNPVPKPTVNTTYFLKVTNEEGATAYDTVSISLKPAPFVDAGRDTAVCSGALIGTPAIAGYTYQWFSLSYSPFGSGTAQTYVYPTWPTSYILRAIGPNGCPAYDTITVSPLYTGPYVLRIETPKTTICKGEPVVFTAVTANLGTTLSYQWKVNDIKVGTNNSTYTTDSLKNSDYVSVEITHSNICLSQPTVGTSTARFTVVNVLNPVVALTGNTIVTEGDLTVISAGVSNAGTNYQLKWQDSTSTHDWQDLPALQVAAGTYPYKPSTTGDKIRCVITVSGTCAVNVVNSPGLSFIVNKITGIEPVPAAQYGLLYYPNPVQSTLVIDHLRLSDRWQQLEITGIDGKQIFSSINISYRTRVEVPAEGLKPGMYVAVLHSVSGQAVYLKFIKL